MDALADEMIDVMGRLERAGMAHCTLKLNPEGGHPEGDPNRFPIDTGAPWKKLAIEQPRSERGRLRHTAAGLKEGRLR